MIPSMRSLRVALFAKRFLEPNHHAILALIAALHTCRFDVYAKNFSLDLKPPNNVVERTVCLPNSPPLLSRDQYDLVHAIFDGDLAFVAAEAARQAGLPFVLSFHGGFDVHVKIYHACYVDGVRRIAREAAAISVVCRADLR